MRVVKVGVWLLFVLMTAYFVGLWFEQHNEASSVMQINYQNSIVEQSESQTINNRSEKNTATIRTLVERDIESILGDILHSLPAEVLKVVLRGEKAKLTQKNQASSATDLKPSNHTKRSGH